MEFRALPTETVTTIVHCVTTWAKPKATSYGAPLDALLDGIETVPRFATS